MAAAAPATVAPPPGCDGRRAPRTAPPLAGAATRGGLVGPAALGGGATRTDAGAVAAVADAATVAVVAPAGIGGGGKGSRDGSGGSGRGGIGRDVRGIPDRGARGDPTAVVERADDTAPALPTRVVPTPRRRTMLHQLANEAVRASGRVEMALRRSGMLFASRGDSAASAGGAGDGAGGGGAPSAGRAPNGHGGGSGGGRGSSSSRRNVAPASPSAGDPRRRSGRERRRQSPPAAPLWVVPPADVAAVERALAAVTPEELCVMPTDYMPTTTDTWAGGDSDSGDERGGPGGGDDPGGDGAIIAGGGVSSRGRVGGAEADTVFPTTGNSRSGSFPTPADDDAYAIIHIPVSVGRLVNMSVFILPAGTAIPLHDHPGMTVVTKVLWGTLHVKSYDLVRPRGSGGRRLASSGRDGIPSGPDHGTPNGWHAGANGGTSPASVADGSPLPPSPSASPALWPPNASVPLPPGLAVAHPPQTLVGGDIRTLGPAGGGNIHHFRASPEGRCALLDVSLPPYDFPGGRGVHYFAPAAALDADTAASLAAAGVVAPPGVTFVTLTEVPSPPSYRTVDAEYCGPTVTVL